MRLPDIESLLQQLQTETRARLKERNIVEARIVGIHSGGAWVAQRLRAALGWNEPIGTLDISFYRDDFTRVGIHPTVRPSQIPWDLENRHLILVDDVLYTGRTVRAALNELFDYGRPASVMLVALISRNGRELPMEAAAVGARIELPLNQQIKLRGPDNLRLELIDSTGRSA